MDMVILNEETFRVEVIEASLPVLVDFTAAWCGPCKMLEPVVKQLAQEWSGKVKVARLDIDANPAITAEYQIMGVPTLVLFVNGRPVQRVSGYQPKERLISRFAPFL